MSPPAVRVHDLGKRFRFYDTKWRQFRGAVLGSDDHAQELWALRHLSFELPRGATLGVIGQNGSGKTTLLQLLAGLLKPTEGEVAVNGNLATLLELGGGFQFELTGRENVFVSGGLRGFSRKEVENRLDSIVAFAELEEFIERPIKHYSSGMLMRLAFATAINVEPDVLLVDEVFSVGDYSFQHKCTRKFRELQQKGATIVLVTHDLMAIKSFCRQTLLLDHGVPLKFGSTEDVTNYYLNLMAQKIAGQAALEEGPNGSGAEVPAEAREFVANLQDSPRIHRHGSGEGKIRGVQILNSANAPADHAEFGEEITFRFFLEYLADVPESILGFFVRDIYGNDILGINTHEEGRPLGARKKGDRVVVDFRLPLRLREGSYSISPGFSISRTEPRYLEWIDNAAFFQMEKPKDGRLVHGFFHVPNEVSVVLVKGE